MTPPTTGGIRSDAAGDGHFGSPRGSRTHKGTDFACYPGEPVSAPMSGEVYRIARPYADDDRWLGVAIRNSEYKAKLFYVDPYFSLIGSHVREGDCIKSAQDITQRYPDQGMAPHVHLEIKDKDGYLDPETLI